MQYCFPYGSIPSISLSGLSSSPETPQRLTPNYSALIALFSCQRVFSEWLIPEPGESYLPQIPAAAPGSNPSAPIKSDQVVSLLFNYTCTAGACDPTKAQRRRFSDGHLPILADQLHTASLLGAMQMP